MKLNNHHHIWMWIAMGVGLLIQTGCDPKSKSPDAFNRTAMLESWADQLIIPSFQNMHSSTGKLDSALMFFLSDPNPTSLEQAQTAWKEVVKKFQGVNGFNFGPATSLTGDLNQNIGTFPVDTTKIRQFIAQMSQTGFNPLNNFNRDTRGLYALDYLLFERKEGQYRILADLNGSDQGLIRAFITAITQDLKEQVEKAALGWPNYRAEFVRRNGIDAGSSLSELYNQWLISFEQAKNFKLGIPLGKRAGQTQTEPFRVEALFSGMSRELLILNYLQIERVYFGRNLQDIESIGFDDYLKNVSGGESLLNETISQMNRVRDALNTIPETSSISDQISTANDAFLEEAHLQMSMLTRFIKSDLSSLLGISITFSSGDGD